MKRELERIEILGEHEARTRAWLVVQAAFAEHETVPRRRSFLRPVLVLVAVGVLAGIIASPPGRAVIDRVREVVGVESAKPALFSLPTSGRLLVSSDAGVWVVSSDGSKRLLGDWSDASWSPFGRFVVAAKKNELAALEPGGKVRWTLARPNVRFPRWGGGRTDTRIAYLSGSALRVVAGDGTGDRKACADAVAAVAPAWRPGTSFELALVAPTQSIYVYDVNGCSLLWHSRPLRKIHRISWSKDGNRLLAQGSRELILFGADGHQLFDLLGPGTAPATDAAISPDGREVAFIQRAAGRSDVWLVPRLRPDASAAHRVFSGTGRITSVTWSPNGRWLLLTWADADQWLFVRTTRAHPLEAVANVSSQFRSSTTPRIEGWCCAG